MCQYVCVVLICRRVVSCVMFSWVVKVVPQPPEKPAKLEEEGKDNAFQTSVSVCLSFSKGLM